MPKITGEKNYQWKGENVSYRNLHRWVEKHKGKPEKCEHCGKKRTTPKSIEWANKDHKYKRDLTHFIALCRKCHIQYDIKHNKRYAKKSTYSKD